MHRYERWFLQASVGVLILFVVVIAYAATVGGFFVPSGAPTIDADAVFSDPRFQEPHVRPTPGAEGHYDAWVIAYTFGFQPSEIVLPAHSTVTFHVTSADVIHGFYIPGTSVNAMLLPGYITTFTLQTEAPGEMGMICDEYCGVGHHFMEALIVVEGGEGA